MSRLTNINPNLQQNNQQTKLVQSIQLIHKQNNNKETILQQFIHTQYHNYKEQQDQLYINSPMKQHNQYDDNGRDKDMDEHRHVYGGNQHGYYITMQMHTNNVDKQRTRKLSQKLATNQLLQIDQFHNSNKCTNKKCINKHKCLCINNKINKFKYSNPNNHNLNHNNSSHISIPDVTTRRQRLRHMKTNELSAPSEQNSRNNIKSNNKNSGHNIHNNNNSNSNKKIDIIHSIYKVVTTNDTNTNTNKNNVCSKCHIKQKQTYPKLTDSDTSLHKYEIDQNGYRNSRNSRNSRNISNFQKLKKQVQQLQKSNIVLGIKQQNKMHKQQNKLNKQQNINCNNNNKSTNRNIQKHRYINTNLKMRKGFRKPNASFNNHTAKNRNHSQNTLSNQLIFGQKYSQSNKNKKITQQNNYTQYQPQNNTISNKIKTNRCNKTINQWHRTQNYQNQDNVSKDGRNTTWYPCQTYKPNSASTHHRTYTHVYTQHNLQTINLTNLSYSNNSQCHHQFNQQVNNLNNNNQYLINNQFIPLANRSVLDKNRSNIKKIDKNINKILKNKKKHKTLAYQNSNRNYNFSKFGQSEPSWIGKQIQQQLYEANKLSIIQFLKQGEKNKNVINMEQFYGTPLSKQKMGRPSSLSKQQPYLHQNTQTDTLKNPIKSSDPKQSFSQSSLLFPNNVKKSGKITNKGVNATKFYKLQQQKCKNKASLQIIDPYLKTRAMSMYKKNQGQKSNKDIVIICL